MVVKLEDKVEQLQAEKAALAGTNGAPWQHAGGNPLLAL